MISITVLYCYFCIFYCKKNWNYIFLFCFSVSVHSLLLNIGLLQVRQTSYWVSRFLSLCSAHFVTTIVDFLFCFCYWYQSRDPPSSERSGGRSIRFLYCSVFCLFVIILL